MISKRWTAPAIAVFFAAVTDLRAVPPVNPSEIIVDRDSRAPVFLAKVNNGTGFFVKGGPDYQNLVFLVTAEHVVYGVDVSTIVYLKSVSPDPSNPGRYRHRYIPQPADKWYLHPDDNAQNTGTEPENTYDIAVSIVGTIDEFENKFSNKALSIDLLHDPAEYSDTYPLNIISLSIPQMQESPVPFTEPRWKDGSVLSFKSNYRKTVREVREIWTPYKINKGDSGSLVCIGPDQPSRSVINRTIGYEVSSVSSAPICGLISGVKIRDSAQDTSLSKVLGLFVVPSSRIKQTINHAFYCWSHGT